MEVINNLLLAADDTRKRRNVYLRL